MPAKLNEIRKTGFRF